MEPEYWVLIIIVAAVIAAVAGFFGGRATAAGEKEVRTMAAERDAAKNEADEMRAEMGRHFEESARMFGRLANDYRSFFEHFAQTAQNLGMSEGRARELLQQADPRLAESENAVDVAAGEGAGTAESDPTQGAPAGAEQAESAEAPTTEEITAEELTAEEVVAEPQHRADAESPETTTRAGVGDTDEETGQPRQKD